MGGSEFRDHDSPVTSDTRQRHRVLVTGAAGYIGSHTVLALARSGRSVLAVDDFSNSSRRVPERLAALSPCPIEWVECDVRDAAAINRLLAQPDIGGVIHFAGRKSVEESCREPLAYFDVNVGGTLRLLEGIVRHRVPRLVFSSSATVYDSRQPSPITESAALHCASPYGRTKLIAEQIIQDVAGASGELAYALLRYFNPVGADASGSIGECPSGPPANLMPAICRVAAGRTPRLTIFGDDYPTRDGTGVRDFIHVDDVARAHLLALERLERGTAAMTLNIGSGTGYSVLEVLQRFQQVNGVRVEHAFAGRRAGDVAELYADVAAAERLLGWRAQHDLDRMCRDAWRWQSMNPEGYGEG